MNGGGQALGPSATEVCSSLSSSACSDVDEKKCSDYGDDNAADGHPNADMLTVAFGAIFAMFILIA